MTEYANSVSILKDSQEAPWKVINETVFATFSNPWIFALILNLVLDFELYILYNQFTTFFIIFFLNIFKIYLTKD